MELLWGRAAVPSRGPKQGLEVETIVQTAIALADQEGLEAISMRRIAEQLECTAMALYTYVPSKAELLDLMLDRTLAELAGGLRVPAKWRARAELLARQQWDYYERHPWVLRLSMPRALLGPNELAAYEAQLRVFDGLGLSGSEIMNSVTALANFVRGFARAAADARAAREATGQSDDQWWAARAPLLEELAPELSEKFPLIARLNAENTFELASEEYSAESYTVREVLLSFDFGLTRLLDGFEKMIGVRAK